MTQFFGDDAWYARLCLTTEILGRFVARAPRAIALDQLARDTGRDPREVLRLCRALCAERLLQTAEGRALCWQLACEPSAVTLEDAYRCVQAMQQRLKARRKRAAPAADATRREVGLLLMQAGMSIDQSMLRLLRQFPLDRLKVAANLFPVREAEAGAGDALPA